MKVISMYWTSRTEGIVAWLANKAVAETLEVVETTDKDLSKQSVSNSLVSKSTINAVKYIDILFLTYENGLLLR